MIMVRITLWTGLSILVLTTCFFVACSKDTENLWNDCVVPPTGAENDPRGFAFALINDVDTFRASAILSDYKDGLFSLACEQRTNNCQNARSIHFRKIDALSRDTQFIVQQSIADCLKGKYLESEEGYITDVYRPGISDCLASNSYLLVSSFNEADNKLHGSYHLELTRDGNTSETLIFSEGFFTGRFRE